MKRAGHLFDRIVDRDNLRLAVYKALKGKRSKRDARAFVSDLDGQVDAMRAALLRGDVKVGEFHQFTIFDPKERLITAPCFRERVLHHAIMNVCEPVFDRRLIADTFACRTGKGQLAALGRAREFAGRSAFFLKIDIRKYFDSINHAILLAKLERLFKDPRLLTLLGRIIDGYEVSPCRGVPIGSLTSQHFANYYLSWLDRFVKEGLRVSGYVRYMDDFALWADSSDDLKGHLADVADFLRAELGLDLKPSPYINRTVHGMDFLGHRVFPEHLRLNRRSRVRFGRSLLHLERAFVAREIDEATLQQRGTALSATTESAGLNGRRFRQSVLRWMPVSGQRPRTE